ncbi:hypothetical protein BGZ51_000826, partial [Haplosporangium sp. Z 767]
MTSSHCISTRTRGLLLSHIHFFTEATTPGSEIYLAFIRSHDDNSNQPATGKPATDSKLPLALPPLPPQIYTIVHAERE